MRLAPDEHNARERCIYKLKPYIICHYRYCDCFILISDYIVLFIHYIVMIIKGMFCLSNPNIFFIFWEILLIVNYIEL